MTKLDRLRWLLSTTEVEEDIPAIAELIRAEELREAEAFMESRDLSRHQVTSIEQATTNYTIQSLLALAKAVGVTVTIT